MLPECKTDLCRGLGQSGAVSGTFPGVHLARLQRSAGALRNANANANANLLKMPIIAPQAVPGRGTSGPVTKL